SRPGCASCARRACAPIPCAPPCPALQPARRRSNASPYRSVNCGTTRGSNSDHSASASTRRMKRSGIQLAILRLWVRRASSPALSRSSRKSSMSACQVSRYTQAAPLRLPPWLTAATEESRVLSHGTIPLECPLVERISEPRERTRVQLRSEEHTPEL